MRRASGRLSATPVLLASCLLIPTSSQASIPTIRAVAGTQTVCEQTSYDDYRLANVVESDGEHFTFFVDANRICKLDRAGVALRVAGTGGYGSSGNGGPALAARFAAPGGLAYDASRSVLYIADTFNSSIRKVDPSGYVRHVAGSSHGFGGDGLPAGFGEVRFAQPRGLALDLLGNMFIADSGNHRIRKIDRLGVVSTSAGGGPLTPDPTVPIPALAATLNEPTAVSVAPDGSVYVAEAGSHRILRIDPLGLLSVVAGTGAQGSQGDGGRAVDARLNRPQGVEADPAGGLLIADTGNYRIRRVHPDGTITTVAGTGTRGLSGDGGPATDAKLNGPVDATFDPLGRTVIADGYGGIRQMAGGIITTADPTCHPSEDGGAAPIARFCHPRGIAMDGTGSVLVADSDGNTLRAVRPGGTVNILAGTGTPGYTGDGGPAITATLRGPERVAVSKQGQVYIADTLNHVVRRIDHTGTITTVAGTGEAGYNGETGEATAVSLRWPRGLAVNSDGALYIADSGNRRVRKVDTSGHLTTVYASAPPPDPTFSYGSFTPSEGQLHGPTDLTLDSTDNLFIADSLEHRVYKLTPQGDLGVIAGNGTAGFSGDGGPAKLAQLRSPRGLAIDSAGDVYIGDLFNHRIRRIDVNGTIETVAGMGFSGSWGDGGDAIDAGISPHGLVLDGLGRLFVTDLYADRLRVIEGL